LQLVKAIEENPDSLDLLLFQASPPEREIFIDNLLVRVHIIIEMILIDRLCATGV